MPLLRISVSRQLSTHVLQYCQLVSLWCTSLGLPSDDGLWETVIGKSCLGNCRGVARGVLGVLQNPLFECSKGIVGAWPRGSREPPI
jgi:hypothetical protein